MLNVASQRVVSPIRFNCNLVLQKPMVHIILFRFNSDINTDTNTSTKHAFNKISKISAAQNNIGKNKICFLKRLRGRSLYL